MKLISIVVNLEAEELGVKFIVQKPDGSAAEGAVIACDGKTATTAPNEAGEVVAIIGPLAAGSYDYTVSLAGHKTVTGTVVVA